MAVAQITSHDLKDNFYALLLSIVLDCSPEQSFSYMGHSNSCSKIGPGDMEDILKLKKTLTYNQIGELYNVSGITVYKKLRQHKKGLSDRLIHSVE